MAFVIRNTFLDVDSQDVEKYLLRKRAQSDHCIVYTDFGDSTTTAGTSVASSEVGSDDVGSWAELISGNEGSWADLTATFDVFAEAPKPEVAQGPPGVFAAASNAPSPAAYQAFAAAEQEDTTIIVRKVPSEVTRAMFLDMLDAVCYERQYTFVYLPMNFQKGVGLGYAIVNFATPTAAATAALRLSSVEFGGNRLHASISEEKQSLSDLIRRYRDSAVMHPSVPDACKPVLYSDGLMVPFPEPTKSLESFAQSNAKRSSRRSARCEKGSTRKFAR
jgi:RNA recognition motif-containing protein